jgi:hypothetical protein
MSDEFDDLPMQTIARDRAQQRDEPRGRMLSRIPELIAEVYRTAALPLRAKLLECLLQPVGPLGLVAIAAGTFGELLRRGNYARLTVSLEDASRISADQMLELARYVQQCNPETFQQITSVLADSPVGFAGLGGSVLLIALRAWCSVARATNGERLANQRDDSPIASR